MSNAEDTYSSEEHHSPDGTCRIVVKDRAGQMMREDLLDAGRCLIETRDYDATGRLTGWTLYIQDGQRKPKRITVYDADGSIIWYQDRGMPPVISKQYQGERPFTIQLRQNVRPTLGIESGPTGQAH